MLQSRIKLAIFRAGILHPRIWCLILPIIYLFAIFGMAAIFVGQKYEICNKYLDSEDPKLHEEWVLKGLGYIPESIQYFLFREIAMFNATLLMSILFAFVLARWQVKIITAREKELAMDVALDIMGRLGNLSAFLRFTKNYPPFCLILIVFYAILLTDPPFIGDVVGYSLPIFGLSLYRSLSLVYEGVSKSLTELQGSDMA